MTQRQPSPSDPRFESGRGDFPFLPSFIESFINNEKIHGSCANYCSYSQKSSKYSYLAIKQLNMPPNDQCPGGVVRSSMKPCRGFDPGSKIIPWASNRNSRAMETPGQGVFPLGPVAQPGMIPGTDQDHGNSISLLVVRWTRVRNNRCQRNRRRKSRPARYYPGLSKKAADQKAAKTRPSACSMAAMPIFINNPERFGKQLDKAETRHRQARPHPEAQ